MMPPRRSRVVTEEEKQLWEQITCQAEKLDVRHIPSPLGSGWRHNRTLPEQNYAPLPASPLLGEGITIGFDPHTTKRMKRGEYPISATLDLHGLSREKAHYALSDFLHAQYDQGSRCLLVITGKGRSGEGGVLRDALPLWLSAPGLKSLVLAIDTAKPQHGGSGAYYILLRRRRDLC